MGAESWRGALAVVPYLNFQLVRPIANGHVRVARTRALERIPQAFLDDAIGRRVQSLEGGSSDPGQGLMHLPVCSAGSADLAAGELALVGGQYLGGCVETGVSVAMLGQERAPGTLVGEAVDR